MKFTIAIVHLLIAVVHAIPVAVMPLLLVSLVTYTRYVAPDAFACRENRSSSQRRPHRAHRRILNSHC
ncbi:hypothetical protein BDZ89DRAFT_542286 [Hymenopellis radicata]|nr:hypothetical protein BDZ89DRAFT_542286 [Hymenopellis radicata]